MRKSVLALYAKSNIPLIALAIDIKKYFDKLPLLVGQESIANASVGAKCYRLMYKLNSKTNVQVKTSVGTTKTAKTGENHGQGSKSAGIVCSLSLSEGVEKYYENSKYEANYGDVKLNALLYQDDSFRVTTTVEGAVDGAKRFQALLDSRALEPNLDKSVYLIFGRKKNVERIRESIKNNPILMNDKPLK